VGGGGEVGMFWGSCMALRLGVCISLFAMLPVRCSVQS
jgi:hypothetical protein